MKDPLLKKFESIAKKKWYVQGFNSCFNYIFHGPVSALVDCYNELGYGYTEILFIFNKDYLDFHYLEQDFIDIGNNFLRRYKKDHNYFKKLLKRDSVLVKNSQKVMKSISKINIKKNKKVIELYKKIWRVYHAHLGVSHIQEGISFVVEPILKEKLEKATGFERHDKKFREIFTQLLQPERSSFVNEEHSDLMRIIKKKQKGEDISKLISAHRKKYFYNQLNYFDGEGLKDSDYLKEIKELIKDKIDVIKKNKEEKERYKNNIKKRKKNIQKFKLSKETTDLIGLSVKVLHWQDDRKKNILSCVYYMHLLLKEIGKRFKIPLDVLKRYSPDEINYENLINFNMKKSKERLKHYAVYMKKNDNYFDCEVYTGNDFKKLMKIYYKTLVVQSDIHGMCASTGKVSGIVRICKTKKDIMDFKKGEILVATMTRPEFVPAMKKSIAIVTDEGGITSHATIVARELGVPCIIGTKVATKVLKNGDLIEVNANHGIVRRLK